MLPNESILQVLHFVDYRTLVLAGFAASRFLHVYTKFTAELARRHNFQINFYGNSIWYSDVTTGGRRKSIPHVVGNQPSLAIACRELDGIIGPQVVGKLVFSENTWNTSTFAVIFESAPPLRYAEEVVLYVPHGSNIGSSSEAYMHNFDGTKALRLWVDCDAFRQFCWTFLSRESACGLRLIEFTKPSDLTRARSAIEEFVLYCVTLPPRLSGDPLELDFSENEFSGRFALRVIELLKDSECELTFRMTLRAGCEVTLDENDYTIDVDGTTTRYESEASGIVVEVKGHDVAIRSTVAVPRKKPRTNEEKAPAVPFAAFAE